MIYSLKNSKKNSDDYYIDVKKAKETLTKLLYPECENIICKFIDFIINNKIEVPRSKEEYFIELLMIYVFVDAYSHNLSLYNKLLYPCFSFFNNLRNGKRKVLADKIRGKLNYHVLYKKQNKNTISSVSDFKKLMLWMNECGDFKEELIRIESWKLFFEKDMSKMELENFFCDGIKFVNTLNETGNKFLFKYVQNVKVYLSEFEKDHYEKEDIIYCGKDIIQYYYNMICSEIMNDVYHNKFLQTKNRYIFVPACMRKKQDYCISKKTDKGYVCAKCSEDCNVRRLTDMVSTEDCKVYIIPHESDLTKLNNKNNSNIGIIGIACVLNLISGGYKALRLGFVPQCVILDECGCSAHWFKEPVMTSINLNRINNILHIKMPIIN